MTSDASAPGARWVAAEQIIDSVVVTGDGNVVLYYADGGHAEPVAPASRADAERLLFGPMPTALTSRPWTWLTPEAALHPVVPRPEEADLVEWARDGRGTALRLVCAPSGQGKTTLALQVCKHLRNLGWTAGVLDLERTLAPSATGAAAAAGSLARPARRWDRQLATVAALPRLSGRALLVVDSAEVHRLRIEELLRTVTELPTTNDVPPVKLLLLARDTGEWWEEILVGSHRHHWIERRVTRLAPVTHGMNTVELDEVWRDAIEGFLRAARQAGMSLAPGSVQAIIEGRPTVIPTTLHLYAAALLRVLDAVAGRSGSLEHRDHPITGLIEHEQRYLAGTFTAAGVPIGHEHARLLLALVCLHAPPDKPEALRTLRRVETTATDDNLARKVRQLRDLYPGGARSLWRAPGPDRLADSVLHTLAAESRSDDDAERLFRTLCATDDWFEGRNCARVLIRALTTADDEPTLDGEPTAAATVSRRVGGALSTLILEHPRGFAPAALDMAADRFERQILKAVTERDTAAPASRLGPGELEALSLLLGSTAGSDSRARIAVAVSHSLIQTDRKAWLSTGPWQKCDQLARLVRYARALRRADNLLGASRAADEAVTLVRQMRELGEVAVNGRIVQRLSWASGELAAAGLHDAALELSTAAVESAWSSLSSPEPLDIAERAAILNRHSQGLLALGQSSDAAGCSGEALQLYREAARRSPGRHERELTGAIVDYGMKLRAAGRPQQAAPYLAEALAAFRHHLTVDDGPGIRHGLALTLSAYGAVLHDLGRTDAAIPYFEQAVKVQRDLAARDPDATVHLADSLGQLGAALAAGSAEAARRHLEEAVATLRGLRGVPRAMEVLATALTNLGALELDPARSVRLLEEALALKQALGPRPVGRGINDIMATAHNLVLALRATGDDARAREVQARFLDAPEERPPQSAVRTAAEVSAEVPPVTEEMRAAARREPGGYLHIIDPAFDPQSEVPEHGVQGAFSVGADGEIAGYMFNSHYRPSPLALRFPPPTDPVDKASQLALTGYGPASAVLRALSSATVTVADTRRSTTVPKQTEASWETAVFTSPSHVPHGIAVTPVSGADLLAELPPQAVLHINPASPTAYRLNLTGSNPEEEQAPPPPPPPSPPAPTPPAATPPADVPDDEIARLCARITAGEPVLRLLAAALRRSRVWYITSGADDNPPSIAQMYDGRYAVFVYSSRAYASTKVLGYDDEVRLSQAMMSDLLQSLPHATYVVINNEGPYPLQIAASALLAHG